MGSKPSFGDITFSWKLYNLDHLNDISMSEGLLSGLLKQVSTIGIPLKPEIINNELTIEISQSDFYEAVTKGLSPDQKNAIRIELHEGKVLIKVKLF